MGFHPLMTFFPLAVLLAFTVYAAASPNGLLAGGTGFSLCQQQGVNPPLCTLTTGGQGVVITCPINSPGGFCTLGTGCPPGGPPPPSTCQGFLITYWILNAGLSVTVPSSVVASTNSGIASFVFSSLSLTTSFYIAIIGIVITVAVIAAVNIFGSGVQGEGIHILFMGGAMLGLWAIISIAEGFVLGLSTSGFAQLNTLLSGIGTGIYVLLTLIYTGSIVAAISRGGN